MNIKLESGIAIEFERFGEQTRPAIVLIRGLGTQLIDWPETFIAGLSDKGYQVLVLDNRDAGLSQKFKGVPDLKKIIAGEENPPYTLLEMAGDVVGLLDQLDIAQAHVFGISMGGMIAQVLTATWPKRVGCLFSVMSSSSRRGLPGPTAEAAASLSAETSAETSASTNREAVVIATIRGLQVCGSPGYRVSELEQRRQAERRFDRNYEPAGAQRQMAAVVATGDRSKLLASIRRPTLVIHGADDPLIPLAAGEDTAAQIPGARLHVIPGMGHDLPVALVPELISQVDDFIQAQT